MIVNQALSVTQLPFQLLFLLKSRMCRNITESVWLHKTDQRTLLVVEHLGDKLVPVITVYSIFPLADSS